MATAAPNTTAPAPQVILEPGEIPIDIPATLNAIEANKPKTVVVRLLKNYCPKGEYEVVGYHRAEKKRKTAGGVEEIIVTAAFVREAGDDGHPMPAPAALPGTGPRGKLWVDTVIRVSVEEAKAMRANGIGEREIDD